MRLVPSQPAFDPRIRRAVLPLVSLLVIDASAALAAPIAWEPPTPPASGSGHRLSRQLDEAVQLLRDELFQVPACGAYFRRLGVDLGEWLSPDTPPFVVPRRLDRFPRRTASRVCGGSQGRPPFELLFVDEGCFRGRDLCALASLLLHEMGHLARQDTRDNEPAELFLVCRLSSCVDPARFH